MPIRARRSRVKRRLTTTQRLATLEAELRAIEGWLLAIEERIERLAVTVQASFTGKPLDFPQRTSYTPINEQRRNDH